MSSMRVTVALTLLFLPSHAETVRASIDCTGSLCNTTDVAEWFAAWECDKVNLAFADSQWRGRGETWGTKEVVISLGQNNV